MELSILLLLVVGGAVVMSAVLLVAVVVVITGVDFEGDGGWREGDGGLEANKREKKE